MYHLHIIKLDVWKNYAKTSNGPANLGVGFKSHQCDVKDFFFRNWRVYFARADSGIGTHRGYV